MVIFLSLGVSLSTSSQSVGSCSSCDTDLIFGQLYCWRFEGFGNTFCMPEKQYSFQIKSCAGTQIYDCVVE